MIIKIRCVTDKLPYQSLTPPNVSAITLRSGRKIDGIEKKIKPKAQVTSNVNVGKESNSKQVDEILEKSDD